MFDRTRTAVKFLVYGLAIGLLFAPRPGKETRAQVLDFLGQAVRDVLAGGVGAPPRS
jgi:hypothetical protein